jgi:hypothetical protein
MGDSIGGAVVVRIINLRRRAIEPAGTGFRHRPVAGERPPQKTGATNLLFISITLC